MLELIETLLTTTSLVHVISHLEGMTLTDMVVVFLLSKPLFILIAVGALLGGRHRGDAHYLHAPDCDPFLRRMSPHDSTCRDVGSEGETTAVRFDAPRSANDQS